LAYFPDEILKCVTFVGYKNQHGGFRLAGSGFWITRAGPSDVPHMNRLAYFGTAAHVIDKVRETSADKRVWLRVNTTDGGYKWYETPEVSWKHHPTDSTVDLAILKIGIDPWFDHVAWPLERLVVKDSLDTPETGDRKVELGDELCIAGLFYPHKGEKRNIPIVRIGNVSSLRNEPVLNKAGIPMDVYLVEAQSMGGLSGSPVFIDIATAKRVLPPSSGHMASAYPPTSFSRFKLFGVIHGHFGIEAELDATADDGKERLPINFGIAMVIPAEKIGEVLTQFDDEEKREASETRTNAYASAAGGAGMGANSTFGVSYSPPPRHSRK
jgi:hypothetical protein